ncbi:hypothetical protein AVEN_244681-1 [Araneus ventricosus]|uniref:RING-type domain-containing protein n=1 Tax=Araneus ventricosus TaxID=182803 RepID=A0A4Y2WV93_ARAVE|nr:hypothetical protein AVEN_244681-1 [Araneus ventricosus]
MQPGCVICKDPFDAAVGIVATKCGHVFHNHCINDLLLRSRNCPECRSNVSENSITKLSFHDISGTNVEISLDLYKEKLRENDLKVVELNKKIKTLQMSCARIKSQNKKLLQENTVLADEIKKIKNLKALVDGSRDDAENILSQLKLQVTSADGKAATNAIATYCSAIKQLRDFSVKEVSELQNGITKVERKLARSKEKKTQLKNKLTEVKRKMKILKSEEKKRCFDISVLEDLKHLPSQEASDLQTPITPSVPDIHSSEHSNLAHSSSTCCSNCLGCENQPTPVASDFPNNSGSSKESTFSAERPKIPILRLVNSAFPARREPENQNSASRIVKFKMYM